MGRIPALVLLPFLISASFTARAQGPTSLQINTPIERTISAGQSHEFTVTLEENAWIQLVVEQRGVDVVVKVFAPSGRSLGEFDSPNGDDGPEHVSFVATAAGVYRINVGPQDQNDSRSGRYQISQRKVAQESGGCKSCDWSAALGRYIRQDSGGQPAKDKTQPRTLWRGLGLRTTTMKN